MDPIPHLDAEQKKAYVLGKLSWSDVEKVETHLGNCAVCRAQVGVMETHDDSFVSCLRGASVEPASADLEKLLAQAQIFTQSTLPPDKGDTVIIVAGHEVRGELARGGLGVVYLAYHPLLRDFRAIKRPLAREDLDRNLLLARFRREVEAVGSLRHDHIIRAHDAGADVEGPYLVMEYLEGVPLSRLLTTHSPLAVPEACELVRQAALGLQAAHERGLVHRDVKPSNLMLARANSGARVVVIDWGLVKHVGVAGLTTPRQHDGLTNLGVAMGTADFIAPEQVRDAFSVDIRADIYSLGATLYCLLAGKPPFYNQVNALKLMAQQEEPFPPLDKLRPDVPKELLDVLNKMVEKAPSKRFKTPGDVAVALQPFCCAESRLLALLEPGSAASTVIFKPAPVTPPRCSPRWSFRATARAVGCSLTVTIAAMLSCCLVGVFLMGYELTPAITRIQGTGPAVPVSMSGEHPGYCGSLAFTSDGSHAVSESGGGGVYIWDIQKRRLQDTKLHVFEQPDKNQDSGGVVAVSPDGKYIAAAGTMPATNYMNYIELYDQASGNLIKKDFAFFPGTAGHAIAFSPDKSRLLATEDLPGLFPTTEPKVRLIEVATGKNWKTFSSKSPVHCFAFSPDGKYLAIAGNEKSIRIRNLEQDPGEREFRGHGAPVDQVAFSADGQRLFSASRGDGTLRVWNNGKDAGAVVDKEIMKIQCDKDVGKILCAALWPGGRALMGHKDGSVVLWNLESGKEIYRYQDKDAKVTAIAVSPDGRQGLAALSDHTVWLHRLPPP